MTNEANSKSAEAQLRQLPSVNRLLAHPQVSELAANAPASLVTEAARSVLETARQALRAMNGGAAQGAVTLDALAGEVVEAVRKRETASLVPAINATGIVLHTGLGRARLSQAAADALRGVAEGHATVEIERETGKRGSRRDHVRGLLCELTGAEDAMVLNNCAGAVFLAVMELAAGRDVIISRGELVEIGGAFRMPDIVRSGGATLVEVGTTNRTRLSDYERAITERTGLILRCHPSNFAIFGFTEETPTPELARLGRERGIPVMDDQGSGALLSPEQFGLPTGQGSLRQSVQAGSDLIAASGDKLLGGPQAGLILGRKAYVERIARHPLARALRVDKFTLAALEATLRLYRDPVQARQEIPTLRYLLRTPEELKRLALQLQRRIRAVLPKERFAVAVVPERSQVGGGSLPGEDLPTFCVQIRVLDASLSPDAMAAALRQHTPPIFARIHHDALLLDPRTLEPDEIATVAASVKGMAMAGG